MALVNTPPDNLAQAIQEPLIEAARVKITGGLSDSALGDPPELEESRTYIVKARCVDRHYKIIDGEKRLICYMAQESIYERGKVPIVDENQPGLFDAAGDDEASSDEAADRDDPDALDADDPELPGDDGDAAEGTPADEAVVHHLPNFSGEGGEDA